MSSKINERAQRLLKTLVDRYIREGHPIGSRVLSRDLDLSPATIRNVMADLEDMGLVCAPHTSAGRLPTAQGLRLFIDTLLQVQPLNAQEEVRLRACFNQSASQQQLVEHASMLLSEITHLAGIVMLPRRDSNTLRHVEFLSLSEKRILVILVINEHEVQNRIIHTSHHYSAAELESAANYLNAAFVGKDIKTVRDNLLQELQKTRHDIDQMMQLAIEVANKAFTPEETSTRDCIIAGQINLMDVAELSDKLRDLFAAFNQKRDVLHLLDQALNAQGVQIFIGEESGYSVFERCSVVASPYSDSEEKVIGVLGVIGPTRMAYERVIPIVNLTAKLLGSALTPQ